MIIAFAHTTPALLAGRKSVTRRAWCARTVALARRQFAEGKLIDAWDKSPRAHGRKVATIRLTEEPRLERTREIPDSDFEAEGFGFMEERGILLGKEPVREVWDAWRANERSVLVVVRFEVVSIEPGCEVRG